ncbi:7,8-didemethyl-8-hydroxy-5-deazariboflavin synthase subunit CofH [Amphritea opalescens]|uniref:FO synthase n=1 Tax=Amphritea opalescens TaxID=2490544 RepID=A0A430KUF4_9GAMM|nr:5-amino-6-(D-ribitylamino)uracil--L-tyrosine 4-hydroxyphenyl transferase CofH [Amphritea opalescens]RTE67088.1 7,8-didemethyl-8-hydroxy-5-deazariboflavin synthase subunit CofH [Amphritea opalescens]
MNAPSILSLDNSVSVQQKLLAQLDGINVRIRDILVSVIEGTELSEPDAVTLFGATGVELDGLIATADYLRQQTVGNQASFVITRNINFTNVCYMGCKFCGFAKRKDEATAELLSFEEVADRAEEAWARGATEVCIQGGLHPDIEGSHYREILKAIKLRVPAMHIHAFSPFEIWFGALKSKMSIAEFIQDLIDHGLGSMPGTAAEILDVEIRQQLTRDKLTTEQWIEIITTAHQLGLPTTATIMYGHIDSPEHWASHIGKIRTIQKKTGGFTEFVPLGFIHYESPLYMNIPNVRPGPTVDENIRMHAVSRLMLHGWVDNIQASWVKLGPEYAQQMLQAGANDLGGTLMNESISRAAGGKNEQEILPEDMIRMISGAGRDPVRRNTLYSVVETFARQPTEIASREGFQLIATTNASVRVAS